MATGYGVQSWGADLSTGEGGGGGVAPPSISIITPINSLRPQDPFIFDVIYADTVGDPTVVLGYPDLKIQEGAYNPVDGFSQTYTARNSYRNAVTQGWRYYLYRAAGWPGGFNLTVK